MARRKPDERQLNLFEFAVPAAAASREGDQTALAVVGPAALEPEHRQLAERLPRELYMGTSSWSFPGWRGLVYDREATEGALARHGLPAYAAHPLLRAVGIDRTYYAPISRAAFAVYAGQTPVDFRFLVKAADACTAPRRTSRGAAGRGEENPSFLDADWAAEHVVRPCVEGLAEKAGPLVFQFSPLRLKSLGGAARLIGRLHAFLGALPRGPLYAVEIRNAEVLGAEYAAMLADVGVAPCYSVHPAMPPVGEQFERVPATGARAFVVRWMLHAGLDFRAARDLYAPFDRIVDEDAATRDALADAAVDAAARRQPVYLIANNKAEGCAPGTIFGLARRVAELRNRA